MNSRLLPIGISILVLFSINTIMVSSLSPGLLTKQLLAWAIGLVLFFIGRQLNLRQLITNRRLFLVISCLLLVSPILLNNITRGSRRWINFGFGTIQPSEIVKPLLLVNLSSSSQPLFHLIPVGLIMLQPDLGSAVSVFILIVPVVLYNRRLLKIFFISGVVLILISPLIWRFGFHNYQRDRIVQFINPASDPLGKGYNLIQSQIAIGSGGLLGKGYKKGTQSQLLFLPEKHTDFVFAAVAEELGLIVVTIIIATYFVLIKNLIGLAYDHLSDRAYFLFTLGTAIQIWAQSVINIGMNIGLLPVTGIPLPLLSVGGSSIMAIMFSLGIIFSR